LEIIEKHCFKLALPITIGMSIYITLAKSLDYSCHAQKSPSSFLFPSLKGGNEEDDFFRK